MTTTNIFEQASRGKLTFSTNKGQLSVEHLWDLSLDSLDTLAKGINRELKAYEEESFVKTRTKTNTELVLRLDILKRVIEVKLQEAEEKKSRAEKTAQLSLLKELKANKQLQDLQSLSTAEIEARIAALEA